MEDFFTVRYERSFPLHSIRVVVVMIVVAAVVAACGQATTKEPSAGALLPNLSDYNMADTADIQDAITKIAGAASLGAGQPELTALVAGVNGLVSCYQSAGAIQGKSYVNKADISKAGVVIVVNRNVLTSPETFLNCVVPKGALRSASIEPCAKVYTLSKDNNQFYIGYAATKPEVCAAFCAALQGCTP
jgi:hypothetical protein